MGSPLPSGSLPARLRGPSAWVAANRRRSALWHTASLLLLSLPFLFAPWASAANAKAAAYHLIAGAVPLEDSPDGNTVILDAPDGLIVVDTGRHPEHSRKILDYAAKRGRPIAAIVNTHWHLDHTTGNWDIRQTFPKVDIYASGALEGALRSYLKAGRVRTDVLLSDPKTTPAQRAQILRGRAVIDHPERIRPNHVIVRSESISIAKRRLRVNLAKFAATEGDVWLYDAHSKLVIAGDLVVALVPFLDTACASGWARALDEIARVRFRVLIPGHGEPMTRADFLTWRRAYKALLSCTNSKAPDQQCIDGWKHDAAKFIDREHEKYVADALGSYIKERLRAPGEQKRFCRPVPATG